MNTATEYMILQNRKNFELARIEKILNEALPEATWTVQYFHNIVNLESFVRIDAISKTGEWPGSVNQVYSVLEWERMKDREAHIFQQAIKLLEYGHHKAEIDAKEAMYNHKYEIWKAAQEYEV